MKASLLRFLSPDRLLSLVLEPAEASAIVGDLMEERPQRGSFWFWTQLLETFAIAGARELSRDPWSLVTIGARSLWHMGGSFGISLAIMVVIDAFEIPHYLRHPDQVWGFKPFLTAAFVLPGLMGGLGASIRAPGREFAIAIVSNAIAVPLFFATLVLAFDGLGSLLHVSGLQGTHLSLLPPMVALTMAFFALGAMVGRNYRLQQKPRDTPASGTPS